MDTSKDRLTDKLNRDSATFAHLRALDPELPNFAWRIILRYTPKISAVQWQAVRAFTIENAVRMKPRTPDNTRLLMCVSARFNAWVWATRGGELTLERVYTQKNVYRYLQERMSDRSESHRWGVVRQLGTIGERLVSAPIKRMHAPRLPGDRPPFTLSEIASIHSWASSLSTVLKRQNAWAIVGLAGGAGLSSEEVMDTRLGDIEITDGRLFVNVPGARKRRVPVMHPWTRALLRSVENRTDDNAYVFHGYRYDEYPPRILQMFLSDHPAKVRATVSRLRTTWITTHLENDLPVHILMDIAGFASATSLDNYLAHAQLSDLDSYTGLIIGEEVSR